MDIAKQKRTVRTQALEARRALPAQKRASLSQAACERMLSLLDEHLGLCEKRAPLIAIYRAMRSELDTAELIERLYACGARVAFPRTRGPHRMEFFIVEEEAWRAPDADFLTHPGRFFPDGEFSAFTLAAPEAIDAVVVPGSAFDEDGMRLGLGAGCYDAYLSAVRDNCFVAGIAFDEQIFERVPADIHDRPMDAVVTPTRTIAFA